MTTSINGNNSQYAAIASTSSNPALELALHKIASVAVGQGNTIAIVSHSSQSGLFFPDVRSINSASFNQKECAPAAHLCGLPYELIARRNKEAGLVQEGMFV